MREARKGPNSDSSWQHLLAAYFVLVPLLPLARSVVLDPSPAKGFAKLHYTDKFVGLAEDIFSGQLLDILRYI